MSKAMQLGSYLKNGGHGTQYELARVIGTTNNGIRSFVSALKNEHGYPISLRRVAGKKHKEYYIPFAKKVAKSIYVRQIIDGQLYEGKLSAV